MHKITDLSHEIHNAICLGDACLSPPIEHKSGGKGNPWDKKMRLIMLGFSKDQSINVSVYTGEWEKTTMEKNQNSPG